VSERGISALPRKNLLFGVKKAHLQKSSHCFVKKKNKVSFNSHLPPKKSEIGYLVHSDDNMFCPCKAQTHYFLCP